MTQRLRGLSPRNDTLRRFGLILAASTSALALLANIPARATTTVDNGDELNLGGATVSDTSLVLIDGSVINGQFNASESFDVRKGLISADLLGLGTLTKTTLDLVTLSGANSYSGGTDILDGILRIENSNALGLGGADASGGVLDLASGLNVFNNILLTGSAFAVNVDSGTARLGGIISDDGAMLGFEKTGGGNLRLTGANTFTGLTTVSAGELTIASAGAILADVNLVGGSFLTFVFTEGYLYEGVVSGEGRLSATNGPLTLTKAQALTNSIFTVNDNAAIILGSAGTLGDGTNAVELRGSGLLDLGTATQTVDTIELDGADSLASNGTLDVTTLVGLYRGSITASITGTATVRKDTYTDDGVLSGFNTYTGATEINFGTLVAIGGEAIGDLSDVAIGINGSLQLDNGEAIGALSGSGSVNLQGNTLTTGRDGVDSIFDGLLAGTGALIKTGSGSLTLTGVNTYEGGTTIVGGTLRVEDDQALGTGQIVTTGSVLDYADGIILANPIVLDSNSTKLQVLTGSATQSGAISQDAGARPLEKTGAGTLRLTAANIYSGLTTITAGTLALSGTGTLGASGGDVTIQSGATLDLTDTSQTLGTLTLNGNAVVTGEVFGDFPNAFLNVGTVNATAAAGETAALDVAFASSGTITKNGLGTLRIGGFPNFGFSGTVEHNAGTLQLIWQEALGSGVVNMNGDVVLSLNNTTGNGQNFFNLINLAAAGAKIDVAENISVQHGEISGSEGFEKTGFGILGIAAPMSFTGLTKITEGGLHLGNGLPGIYGSLAGPIEIGAAGYLDILRQDMALDLAGVISGAGGISTNGLFDFGSGTVIAGKWTLSGDNTYSGGTSVNAGTLRAGSATAFGTGSLNASNVALNAPDSISTFDLNGFDISASGLFGNGVFDLGGDTLSVLGSGGFLNGATFTAGNLTVADGANQAFSGVDLSPIVTLLAEGRVDISGSGNVAPQTITLGANGHLDFEFLTQAEYVANQISGAGEIFLDDSLLTLGTGDIDVTLSSLISGTGGSLKKAGAGILTLSGDNNFSGGIELAQGTLRLASNGAAGLGPITTTGSIIDYANGVNSSAPIIINSSDTQLQVLTGIATQSGIISETGGARPLEKIGIGNLVLTAANTYTGLTTVTDGRLQLGTGGTLAGNVFVGPSSNAWFDFASTDDTTFAGVLTGGNVAHIGTGTTTWTGANTHSYTGIADGTLLLSGSGTLGGTTAEVGLSGVTSAVLDLGGTTQTIGTLNTFAGWTQSVINGTLNVNSLMRLEEGLFSANLGGTGTLIKNTGATTTLSGTNTFTGQTAINGGTLVLQNGSALDDLNEVTVAPSATLQLDTSETIGSLSGNGLLALGGSSLTTGGNNLPAVFGGTTTGSTDSQLIKTGTGLFTIENDLGHLGQTVVNGGEINFNSIAAGSFVVNSGGRLSGTHTINGNLFLASGGTLAPGNSPGTATVLGDFTGGGILEIEVQFDNAGAPVNGITHDFLDIAGNVLGGPTTVSLLTFAPSGTPAATTGNGIEIVRVAGATSAADFTMTSYLLGDYFYDLAYLQDYSVSLDGFFLQSSLATPGCVVDNTNNACFIDSTTNQLTPVEALAGNDTLQLTGATNFDFNVGGIGTTYTNFEVFQKAGTSTVTLTGTTSDTNLGIDVQNGTLIAGTNQLGAQGAINIFTPGTLQLASGLTVGSIAGSGNILLDADLTTGSNGATTTFSGIIDGAGGLNKDGSGTLFLSNANTFTGLTSVLQGQLQLVGNGALSGDVDLATGTFLVFDRTIAYTFGGDISGAGGIFQGQLGTITLTGTNTHASTQIGLGTLAISGTGTLGAANVQVAVTGVGSTLDLDGSTQDIGSLSINQSTTNSVIDGTLNVTTVIQAIEGTISANLTGTANLTKLFPGIATLSGTNDFSGTTTISAGTLVLQNGAALADTTAVTVNGGGFLQLDLSETIGSLAGTGGVTLGSHTLTTGGNDASTTFSGAIAGAGGLVKNGLGVFNLQGTNAYGGGTTVNAGTLLLGGASGLITGDVTVASDATFEFNRSNNLAFGGVFSGAGTVKQNNPSGAITLTAANLLTGTMLVTNGTLAVSGAGTFGDSDNVTLSANGPGVIVNLGGTSQSVFDLIVNQGATVTGTPDSALAVANSINAGSGSIAVDLSGNATLTKSTGSGGNTVTLSGDNTYTGATQIQSGVLQVGGGHGIGDTSTLDIFAAGTLELLAGETVGSLDGEGTVILGSNALTITQVFDATWSGDFSGGSTSQLIKNGASTLTIAADLDHLGDTVVNEGEVRFTGTAAGSFVVNAGGTLSGSSTISGNLTLASGATLATGESPGTTTVLGDFIGGGNLDVEVQFDLVGGPDNGVTHDFLSIGGDVLAGPTTISLLSFPPSGDPAATSGLGVELVRVGGVSSVEDFSMVEYLFGDYFYNLVFLPDYDDIKNGYFLQSTSALPGCIVSTGSDACFIDEAANALGTAIDALAGNDTLQLNGVTDFTFDVSRIGTLYTNFEIFQKAGTNTVTLSGIAGLNTLGFDVQNGMLIAGTNQLGSQGAIRLFTPGILRTVSDVTTGSLEGSGTLDVISGLFQTGNDNTSTAFSGNITGAGDFQKTGTGTLTLSGTNSLSGFYSIIGGVLEVSGGDAINGASRVILDPAGTLRLLANETIGSLEGTLISGGTVDLGGHTLTLGGNNFATLFTGAINGSGGLTKVGNADLTLGGTNGYTGATTISGGTLTVQGGSAIADSSAVTVGTAASLLVVNAETIGSLSGAGGVNLFANTLTAGGNGASTTYSGAFTGTGAFAKAGGGIMTLSGGTAAASVDMLVQGGRLIAGAGTLGTASANTVGSGATFEVSGDNTVASIVGAGALEVNSAALIANFVVVDHFTLNGGSLGGGIVAANLHDILAGTVNSEMRLGNSNIVNIAAGALITSAGTPVKFFANATGPGIQVFNNGAIQTTGVADGIGVAGVRTGNFSVVNTGSITSAGGTALNFGEAGSLVGHATGNISISNSGTISGPFAITTGDGNDTLSHTTAGTISGRVSMGAGINSLMLSGLGAGTFFGENSSATPVSTDWLGFDNVNVNSGTWTLFGGGYYDNVVIDAGATLIANDTGFGGATDGGLGEGESGALQLTVNGTFKYIANSPPLLYGANPSSTLAGNGVVDLTSGGGLVLAGNNTFTGQMLIGGGARVVVTGSLLGDIDVGLGSQLIIGATLVPAGADGAGAPVFDVGGAGATGDVSGDINLVAGGLLKFNRTTASVYSGNLSGDGKLIKDGAGMLSLTGLNTFSGGIDILHGGVFLGNNSAAGSGPITTFSSVISYANGVNIATPIVLSSMTTQLEVLVGSAEQSGPISETGGARPIEKIGVGNLTLSGMNSFTGPTTITAGSLTAQSGSALADGANVFVASGAALALNTSEIVGSLTGAGALNMSAGTALTAGGDNSSTVFSGNMNGGGFTKTGTGNFAFSGVGAFGGPLAVSAGTFTKTGGGLSGASAFSVGSGATAFLGATTAGVNGGGVLATSMGAVATASGGTIYLDDNSSVSGSTLSLASGGSLGLFLTTNTAVYPQLTMSGAASVAGNLGIYLDPMTFGATTATTFNYDNVISGVSRSGTFNTVSLLQTPNNLFSLTTVYGANDVDLVVQRASFSSLSTAGNNGNLGGAIETIFVNGTSNPDLINLINTLAFSSPSAISAILSPVSGSTSAETEGAGLRTDDPWKQSVAERVNAARATGCVVAGEVWCFQRYAQASGSTLSDIQGDPSAFDWLQTGIRDSGTTSAWSRAIGVVSETDGSDNAPGSQQRSGGLIVGIDHVLDSALLAGLAGQYVETHVDFDGSNNASVVKAVQVGAYVSQGDARAFINGNVSVIGSQGKSARYMTVGLLSYEIESFMRSLTGSASVEAGSIWETGGFRFEPTIALNYQYSSTDEYREKGGGGLGLLINPEDTQSLKGTITARLSRVFDIGDRKIVPQIRADWRHEFLDRGQSFQAAFAGAPGVLFEVDGTKYARDTMGLGASVTVPISGQMTGYVDAQGALSSDTVSTMLTFGVRASW